MRALLALVIVLALTGWGSCQRRDTAPAFDAPAACYQPATPTQTDTGVRWDRYPPSDPRAWDDLAQRVVPELTRLALTAEQRRALCAGVLSDLKRRGVLRAQE